MVIEYNKKNKKKCQIRYGEASKSVIVKTDGIVFGKIRSDLEDLAFLRCPQGKPSGRSKCLSRRESEGDVR
jgi:hypothetical protein